MNPPLPKTLTKFILHYTRQYKWGIYAFIGLAFLAGTYGTINSYLTKILIDNVAKFSTNNQNLLQATLIPGILIALSVEMHNLAWRSINYVNIKITPKIKSQMIQDLFSYVHQHSFRFFQDNFSGAIANNIGKLADNIEMMINALFLFILRGVVQLILAFTTMYFVHPIFSFVLFTWVSLFLIVSLIYSNKVKHFSDGQAKAQSVLSGKIIDSISNVANVRLFSRENFERQYLKKYLNIVIDKFRQKEWFMLKLQWVQGMSITLLMAVIVFALIHLRMKNLVTIGDFAFILGLVLYVTDNVWWLTEQIDKLNDAIGQCNQSLSMIMVPHDITDIPHAKQLVVTQGEINFRNVTFNYHGRDNLFRNKSIIIPSGEKVGLVGFSGSGKTTFVNLIVRLFETSSGSITIDNQNIAEVSQGSLREQIGFIPQDPVLFHRSLMDNIRYGKSDATDEEVILAAKKAHADEFITLTNEGYNSLVGERGIKLSGGQRQRISIARAIIKNAPILILDEATSALDSVTEGYIQDSLVELMQGKTVIVIAHRLSTLLNMDRILVFHQGKIVEEGTHTELLSKAGMYTLLWNSQVGGFLLDELNKEKM